MRGPDLTLRDHDGGPLRLLVVLRLSGLLFGDQPLLEESGERVPIPLRLRMRGLGLGELSLGRCQPRLCLTQGRLRLLLAGADLLVIEHCDDRPRAHLVALSHGDLANPSGGLGRDRRVVAFDPAAHGDHARRQRGGCEDEAPHREPAKRSHEQKHAGNDETPPRAVVGLSRRRSRRDSFRRHLPLLSGRGHDGALRSCHRSAWAR